MIKGLKTTILAIANLKPGDWLLLFEKDGRSVSCPGCGGKKFSFWIFRRERQEVICDCFHCGQTGFIFPDSYLVHILKQGD
jgi:hypothetical protein